MNKLNYAKIDNRFATAARQAAKALGVKIGDTPRWKAGAMYDRLRWHVEAFMTADDRILVISQDDLGLSAAVIDDFEHAVPAWLERDAMDDICRMAEILDQDGLVDARRDLAEIAAFA